MKIFAAVRVVDTETTGLDAGARVVELGWCHVFATAENESGPTRWVVEKYPHFTFVNPGIPIPPEAQAEHHISDEDVAEAPDLDGAVQDMSSLHALPPECPQPIAYAAHNAKFDRQFLDPLFEAPWICSMRCWQHVLPDAPSFKNQALRYLLKPRDLDPKKAMPPHRAGPDAYVTAHLVRDLLNRGNSVEKLVRGTLRPPLLKICPIGNEWRGKTFESLDTKALRWLRDRPDSEEIRATAQHWLEQRGAA